MNTPELQRLPVVLRRIGKSRSTVYAEIKAGLMTPPVPIGGRAVAWPDYEIDQIIHARIAGWPDERIRELVTNMVAMRSASSPARHA